VSADEVMVFVSRGDEWLVLRRSERQGGYWHAVAGGVEEHEEDCAAAARELHEEVGLRATPRELGIEFSYAPEPWEPRFRPGGVRYRVACFHVEAPTGWEPTLDWEHDEYRWCSADEGRELLRWPEPRRILAEIA
jgi:8-oxo-dGTP pyrophosphatase MutT (NUDIX family)